MSEQPLSEIEPKQRYLSNEVVGIIFLLAIPALFFTLGIFMGLYFGS